MATALLILVVSSIVALAVGVGIGLLDAMETEEDEG